ncbi:olfactory receptor 1M1-like [Erpetoichthys calabaricus]|uniref:olfactory receptor 1M1-like n=1 Tax=Erpetoichthys calabaricus TaxID=27687 RepID=UPI0022343223|nr:olfactory receptor 1M1-like [Erpetoichthys calabaricus]
MFQEFILVSFPGFQDKNSRSFIFGVLLLFYCFIVFGNLLIVMMWVLDKEQHSPMYVLISNLALVDIIISTTTIPKMLSVFSAGSSSISVTGCFIQMFICGAMNTSESLLLALMAYDRYIAICRPLHYFTVSNNSIVTKQIICCWLCAFIVMIAPITVIQGLLFCGSNVVVQTFCDSSSILRLACSDTSLSSYVILAASLPVIIVPLVYILMSYTRIVMSVLQITNSDGRQKAFSTCSTHLLVLLVFFLVGAGVHISTMLPDTSPDAHMMASVLQNVIPPLLNPIIYCWRTKEFRDRIRKMLNLRKLVPYPY